MYTCIPLALISLIFELHLCTVLYIPVILEEAQLMIQASGFFFELPHHTKQRGKKQYVQYVLSKAQFKRRISVASNSMQMSKNHCLS